MENFTKRRAVVALGFLLCFLALHHQGRPSSASPSSYPVSSPPLRRRLTEQNQSIRPYSYVDIEKSASLFVGYYARIVIFDGVGFSLYNLRDKNIELFNSPYGGRALRAISLLVEGLKSNFPDRFKPGQPPFQVMYADGDSINLGEECTSDPQHCSTKLNLLPPLLAHGSVPVKEPNFPFVKAFPNWFYGDCIYNWKVKGEEGPCRSWWQREGTPVEAAWDDLIPTIVWRGSDHAFVTHIKEYQPSNMQRYRYPVLETVTETTTREELIQLMQDSYETFPPRWRGVIQTVLADSNPDNNIKWIDVRFHGQGSEEYHQVFNDHGVMVRDQGMTATELAKFRYQIDFGGGGGTTWRGVLTKLAMPGVLFHHETAMKDWFFDLMIPWIHYIPVSWDLSNLEERYHWAQANPQKCQEISKAATELSHYILSQEYMERLYNQLYRDYLGKVIDAYQPTALERELKSTALLRHYTDKYDEDGYEFTQVSMCDDQACRTTWNDGKSYLVPYVKNMKTH